MQIRIREASIIFFISALIVKDVPVTAGLTEYQCTYRDQTLTCYTSVDNFACCLEKYSRVPIKCGDYCFGEISYEKPTNIPPKNAITPSIQQPYFRRGFVDTNLLLVIILPVGLLAIIIMLCKYRCGIPQGITGICCSRVSRERTSSHDLENALNESRQQTGPNTLPPTYDEAECNETSMILPVQEQPATDSGNTSGTDRLDQLPAYEDVNSVTVGDSHGMQQPPSYSCIALPSGSADEESNLPPAYHEFLTPTSTRSP
ncbi:uncharacterized protein [Watersipora subatra]|uniref:uncharacterized protein isoform X2 n=1 Tax=Watersipora subatra TaxID=2589382 RepID=UPI00355AF213